MKYYVLILLSSLGCLTSISKAQVSEIGSGWAQNSVNAVIFRKNSVVSHEGKQYASYYDSLGNVVLARRLQGTDDWQVERTPYKGNIRDAHCSISIMVDGEGYLHLAWDHHNSPLHYCRSLASDTLVFTGYLPMTGFDEEEVTYPEFHRLPDGDLIFMYRQGESGKGNLVINRYYTAEKKWIRLHDTLISGEGERNAYWQACIDPTATIHISWVWRETWDVATNRDMGYARSTDGGESWENSKGEVYALPITAATAEYVARIPMGSELINQTSMFAGSDGRPFIATYFAPDGSSVPQYHLIYQHDSSWIIQQITDRKTPFSLSGGGTKRIPVSRPQILVENRDGKKTVYLIYRDVERGNRASVTRCRDLKENRWQVYDISDKSMGQWEPSYDTELWRTRGKLHIYLQKIGQEDAEGLEDLPSQPVYIYEFPAQDDPFDKFFKE